MYRYFRTGHLQELDLYGTKITSLSESIRELTNLLNLDVSDNPNLKDFSSISKLKNLEVFSYTLYKNKNYASIKTKLKILQKELPNCTFDITNKQGEQVEL